MQRYQQIEYIVPFNGQWVKISEAWLKELSSSEKRKYAAWDDYIGRMQRNPLSFVLAHGSPRADGTNDGMALLNDDVNDLILLTAGNQYGKSFLAAAFIMLRCVPCDKSWPCFAQHGIKHIEWAGPKQVIIASYSWDEVNVIWNTYRKLLPRHEMRNYSPYWGYFPDEMGRPKDLRFHNIAKKVMLDCGTELTFLSYVQSLTHWEGKQCDLAHLDEQCPEDKFDALTARQTTRGGDEGFTPIIMSLTGHVVPERPDTGAAGWIKRKIVDANVTKGRRVGKYKIALEDVPDVIISPEKKRKMYIQWVEEPRKNRDEKKQREAEARYYGGWEVGGGITLCEWNPEFHVIEPFNVMPFSPTLYRMIDHGQNPCACGVFAVMPWGDIVLIKEYYEYGKNIFDNAEGIVAMCGNSRRKVDYGDGSEIWEEVQNNMEFRASELDARSFARKSDESGKTIGRLYNEYGCACVPATGMRDHKSSIKFDEGTIPLLKDALAVRKDGIHIDCRLERPRDKKLKAMGAPKFYIFSTCKNTRSEIERWMGTGDDCDDMISCCKFMTARDRPYMGDFGKFENVKDDVEEEANSVTGY